ncbi:unannotated protein [freshwater metagenome]|jgi:hypothetical protein|uniref:Unannotated protein n=1 Tax=freshwater metagenome TaxID=449393 RepID=A0A6J6EX02_9ZZZZ|nr:hypothetical protein [Actinomycetota bacterium]
MSGTGFLSSRRIVRLDVIGTVVFTVSAVFAAVVFDGPAKVQGVVVDLALFTVGVAAFLWGYWVAVQRSRQDELSVAELYFLLGAAIPRDVKRTMNLCLLVQTVVAVATAMTRLTTPSDSASSGSSAGSTLAFGVLVPMFGLGLNGLWAAVHGTFGPRRKRSDDDGIG